MSKINKKNKTQTQETKLENLEILYNKVIEHQINVIDSGEATSADISNCLKLFKDNSITIEKSTNDNNIEYTNILEELKFDNVVEVEEIKQLPSYKLKNRKDINMSFDIEE
jgi:hypothetical protein